MASLGRKPGAAPITSADIPDNSITAAKIVDATIAAGDLASDVVISTSGAITTTGAFTSIGIDDDANALAMTIDANENVGIGTATPTEKLHVRGTDNTRIQINSTGGNSQAALQLSNDAITYSIEIDDIDAASDSLYIRKDAGATPVFMISSAGNVGIGVDAPDYKLHIKGSSDEQLLHLQNTAGGDLKITCETAGSAIVAGSNQYLRFLYDAGATEAMRIADGGIIGMATSPQTNKTLCISGVTTTGSDQILNLANSSDAEQLYVTNNGYGWINAASWNYSSDIKLKENIVYLESTLDKINSLKPCSFDYIDGSKSNLGFIAQDVQVVVPEAISNSAQEGEEELLGMKTNFIIPLLTKAIQELSAKVTALESA